MTLTRNPELFQGLSMGMTQVQLILVYSVAVIYAVALTYVSGDDVILQKRVRNSFKSEDETVSSNNKCHSMLSKAGSVGIIRLIKLDEL